MAALGVSSTLNSLESVFLKLGLFEPGLERLGEVALDVARTGQGEITVGFPPKEGKDAIWRGFTDPAPERPRQPKGVGYLGGSLGESLVSWSKAGIVRELAAMKDSVTSDFIGIPNNTSASKVFDASLAETVNCEIWSIRIIRE